MLGNTHTKARGPGSWPLTAASLTSCVSGPGVLSGLQFPLEVTEAVLPAFHTQCEDLKTEPGSKGFANPKAGISGGCKDNSDAPTFSMALTGPPES